MRSPKIVYTVKLGELAEVPGTPFAYWAPKTLRDLFQKFPPLDRDVARMPDKPKIADVKVGLQTSDDLRFTRFWWEVPVEKIGTSNEETFQGKKWVPFENDVFLFYFYGGLTTVVNWEKGGEEIKRYIVERYPYLQGKWEWVVKNESFYFRAGLAWSVGLQRSQLNKALKLQRMPFRILPKGCIFGVAAQGVLANEADRWWLLVILTSRVMFFISRCIGIDKMPGTSYCAELPIALPNEEQRLVLTSLSREAHDRLREWATGDETATVFVAPWILQVYDAVRSGTLGMPKTGHPLSRDFEWRYGIPEASLEHARNALQNRFSLYALAEACVIWEAELRRRIDEIQKQIDDEVFHLYEISDEDRAIIETEMGKLIEAEELEDEEIEAEGEPEEKIQSEDILSVEEHIKRFIHYLAHQVIKEDPDGIVPLKDCYLAGGTELELGLASRVRKKLEEIFGQEAMSTIERELQQALGSSLEDWLAEEFFSYHIGLFRLRPIIWQIVLPVNSQLQRRRRSARRTLSQSMLSDFSVFIYWHKLDSDTLRKIRYIYLQPFLDSAEREVNQLEKKLIELLEKNVSINEINNEQNKLKQARYKLEALKTLAQRIEELLRPCTFHVESRSEWVRNKVNEIVSNGYRPNLDYGVRVNIEPFKQKGILHRDAERVKG